jgi:hypothetical protein
MAELNTVRADEFSKSSDVYTNTVINIFKDLLLDKPFDVIQNHRKLAYTI